MFEIGILLLLAYFCGSLSGAFIISRLMHLPNPSLHGSKNPGATNMLRVNGKLSAFLVLIFDIAKGYIPVYVAYHLGADSFLLGAVAIMACIGHIFPCFFKFTGGKGVATAFGAIMIVNTDFTLILMTIWLLSVLITGYSSLGAVISFMLAPPLVWFIEPDFIIPVSMLSCLILLKHGGNIRRLVIGQEYRFTRK